MSMKTVEMAAIIAFTLHSLNVSPFNVYQTRPPKSIKIDRTEASREKKDLRARDRFKWHSFLKMEKWVLNFIRI